ncbi:unnamed protein product [Durusdinium trenchii]|uniref:Solute carrier family 40 protein n=1 Tax=Durusdinium trenchii TaxID=1381693 RepID=A0ABP0QKR0_9DINO
MATGGPLDSDGEQDPRIRADLDKEIQAAEETVQALRHSLLKAELRLKALRQRRNGGGASHPAESQRCTAPKAWQFRTARLAQVGFGQLKGLGDWLAQQSNSLLQQAEAAGEQEAQLRTRRRQQLERQSEEQLQRDADAESERVVRQHALDFLDQTKATAPLVLLFMAILYGGNVPLLKTVELGAPLQLTGPELLALRFLTSTVRDMTRRAACKAEEGEDGVRAVLIPSVELAIWLFAGSGVTSASTSDVEAMCCKSWCGLACLVDGLPKHRSETRCESKELVDEGLEKTSASTCAVASALTGPFVQILELLVDGKQIAPFVALCSAGTFSGIALFVTAPSLTQAITAE